MKYKVAIIGDYDSILGFKTLGIDIFGVNNASEAENAVGRAEKEGYAIIYITEHMAEQIPEKIDAYSEKKIPAIIPVPSISGKTGMGMKKLRACVKKAVGIDLFNTD